MKVRPLFLRHLHYLRYLIYKIVFCDSFAPEIPRWQLSAS